jgi:transcription termination factor NusB
MHKLLDTVQTQNPPLDTVQTQKLQRIIQDNKSKEAKYGVPENCITGILENSEQLQAIIKKDWKKLEQLNTI